VSDPIDIFLEMHKQAGLGDFLRAHSGEIGRGAATAAGGMALAGVGAAAKKIHDAMAKRQEFKQMMQLDPELHQAHAQDPEFFNAVYTSLRSVNPTFGRDPIVSGAYMRQLMDDKNKAGLMIASSVRQPTPPTRSGLGINMKLPIAPGMELQKAF
jgi:hypothetical protein